MNDIEFGRNSASAPLLRRDFLRNSVLLATPAILAGMGVPLSAAAAVYDPPSRARGDATRNVRDYGAVGNGIHDDTSAIQAAINSLPSIGGTVFVPAGTYLVDAVRSVKLRSLMHFKLDPGAKLVAKPNSAEKYTVLHADGIHDIEISGGQIVGDRDHHKGTTGEGGHGIRVSGSRAVTIRDILISKGWGDGISVGPKPERQYVYSRDVVVANVVCTQNRRNGLSIGNVLGMKVYDSEFSYTHGTSPQCGIDVEPSQSSRFAGYEYNDLVWIENCVIRGNEKYGINVWKHSRRLTVTKCTMYGNLCGMVTRGLTGGSTITGNTIHNNAATGLFIQSETVDVAVNGNTSYNNYTKQGLKLRSPFYLVGVNKSVERDIKLGDGTSRINVGKNYYK